MYIADTSNHRIRVVDLDTGIIQTFAGTGTAGTDGQGDGEHALDAALNAPSFLSLGPDGLYLASSGQHEIRWIDDAGIIQTLLTDGTDCGQELALRGCATGCAMLWAGDDSALISGRFCGTLFGATSGTAREAIVRRYSDGSFEHVAGEAGGNTTPSGPLAVEAAFTQIGGMALDSSQNLYLCEYNSHRVRMIDEDGRVQVVAGNGTLGDAGDFGPATDANLNYPGDIVFLADGRLLISDYSNYAIRTVWP